MIMLLKKYLALCLIFISNISLGQEMQNKCENKELHVFILMGQSNMAGYGEILTEDTIPVNGVWLIPTISDKEFEWEPAKNPLHNRLQSDRFGLGIPFAKEYLKNHPNVNVGLIPVAWGGAGIDLLNKGTATYQDALSKSRFAQESGIIKGILWHQGESDTVNEELVNTYECKLHQLILDLRNDLRILSLPFIVGNLAEFYGTGKDHCTPERVQKINRVKNILRSLPDKINLTGFVESKGCFSIDQHMVHFDRNSYIILGKRYAAKYEEILKEELK
jgi:hypothetical protein